MQRQLHILYLIEEELRYKQINFKLQKAYEELENINWIGTHDLKEPLRKIQILASKILESSDNSPEVILAGVNRMNNSANRMQALISDILYYSRITNANEKYATLSLPAPDPCGQ